MIGKSDVPSYGEFILPSSVITKADVAELVNEVEIIDNELTSATVRKKAGVEAGGRPRYSDRLSDFLNQNELHISASHQRTKLIKQLRELKDSVPVLHMTFASEADADSLQRLITWVRTEAHPQAVLHVGVQPGLVAGVYLRTPNHIHDFSLRHVLKEQRGALVKQLEALRG